LRLVGALDFVTWIVALAALDALFDLSWIVTLLLSSVLSMLLMHPVIKLIVSRQSWRLRQE
jgi:hypothetical protein